jgi:hypothetical protein
MSLVDRYVAEVGRHLPGEQRADIEAEIRSNLEDMIEDSGEDKVVSVLKKFGDPELLARKYTQKKNYLIGRHWYEVYVEVLERVLSVALPVSLIVWFFIKFAEDSDNLTRILIQSASTTFNIGIHIWFWITVVFVFLEHSNATPIELGGEAREWSPDLLPQLPKPRQISISEGITDVILTLGGIGLVAFSSSLLRVEDGNGTIPLLHPDLWKVWLPIFFGLAGLTLLHDLFKIKIGNWTPALTATNILLSLASIGYLLALVFTQDIVNPAFVSALKNETPAQMQQSVTWTIWISVAIIIGCYLWSIVNSIIMAKRLPVKK